MSRFIVALLLTLGIFALSHGIRADVGGMSGARIVADSSFTDSNGNTLSYACPTVPGVTSPTMVVMAHGGSGSGPDFLVQWQAIQFAHDLTQAGYCVMWPSSTDRSGGIWSTVDTNCASNPDCANIDAAMATIVAAGKITCSSKLVAGGMSNGANFDYYLASLHNAEGSPCGTYAAIFSQHSFKSASYLTGCPGSCPTTIPTYFVTSGNDSVMPNVSSYSCCTTFQDVTVPQLQGFVAQMQGYGLTAALGYDGISSAPNSLAQPNVDATKLVSANAILQAFPPGTISASDATALLSCMVTDGFVNGSGVIVADPYYDTVTVGGTQIHINGWNYASAPCGAYSALTNSRLYQYMICAAGEHCFDPTFTNGTNGVIAQWKAAGI